MDQFISSMAKKDHALKIDCEQPLKENCATLIPFSSSELVVLVTDTGVRHELADGEYNKRRETCEAAASKLGVRSLRYASMQQLQDAKGSLSLHLFWCLNTDLSTDKLTDLEFRRAHHVISEIKRTEQAAEALQLLTANYEEFGTLMNKSHDSLR